MAVHVRTPQLTERQREVVAHVRQGYTNREIGEKLAISEDGVKAHLSRLYLRYGVTNRVELIASLDETTGLRPVAPPPAPVTPRARLTGPAPRAPMPATTRSAAAAKLSAVREALMAVDAALGMVGELPPDTTEPIIGALKRRLGGAITALDEAERAVITSAGGAAS